MFTGNSINKETLCNGIRYIPFKGELPFRRGLGESGKFYLCNVTNLLATKDCITFQVKWPAKFPSWRQEGEGCPVQRIHHKNTVIPCDVLTRKGSIPTVTARYFD